MKAPQDIFSTKTLSPHKLQSGRDGLDNKIKINEGGAVVSEGEE